MKIRVIIAVLLIGALLCSGIVVAEKPAKETVRVTKFIHYKDTSDNVKEKTLPVASTTNQGRVKTPKPTATPAPTPDGIISDNSTATGPTATATPEPTATATLEPTATITPKPTETATPAPTGTGTPTPTETAIPDPTETVAPTPTETAAPTPTETATPKPTETATPTPTKTATPTPTETAIPEPTAAATPEPTATATPEPTATATPVESDLYKLKGMKWTEFPVTFYVNPDGSSLDADAVALQCAAAFVTWDEAVGVSLVADGGKTTTALGRNGRNEVYWSPITTTGVVAQTMVYWTSSGTILEADIQMNSNTPWGIDEDGEGTLYKITDRQDVRNIATHEAGHAFGLGDLYDSSAIDLTMYGYSTRGQTKKISLGYGDILGIQALYGA